MGLSPPVPIAAIYEVAINRLTVTFDSPLNPQPILGNTITFRVADNLRRATAVVAAGSTVQASSTPIFPNAGPDIVRYRPPPFDIKAAVTLIPAPAFEDFPLTVV